MEAVIKNVRIKSSHNFFSNVFVLFVKRKYLHLQETHYHIFLVEAHFWNISVHYIARLQCCTRCAVTQGSDSLLLEHVPHCHSSVIYIYITYICLCEWVCVYIYIKQYKSRNGAIKQFYWQYHAIITPTSNFNALSI